MDKKREALRDGLRRASDSNQTAGRYHLNEEKFLMHLA